MRIQKLFFPFALLIFVLASCSNEFEVGAPWKEIPITFAVLDATKDVQYIRVEKAFIGNESALKLAKVADSLYYPADAITVFLEQMDGDKVKRSLQAVRVDGRDEGIVREDGIFATEPNWLYKVTTSGNDTLTPGTIYRVRIQRKDGKPDITGSTGIPRAFRWDSPLSETIYNSPTFPRISFDTSGSARIAWRCDEFGVFFDADLIIRYRDANPLNGQTLATHEIKWAMGSNRERGTTVGSLPPLNYKGAFQTSTIFKVLEDSIPPADDKHRFFQPFTLTLTGGGREIKTFNESLSANAGITSAEVIGLYTNMSEGFGIVTAKSSITTDKLGVFNEFVKNVQDHYRTRNLNFKL